MEGMSRPQTDIRQRQQSGQKLPVDTRHVWQLWVASGHQSFGVHALVSLFQPKDVVFITSDALKLQELILVTAD